MSDQQNYPGNQPYSPYGQQPTSAQVNPAGVTQPMGGGQTSGTTQPMDGYAAGTTPGYSGNAASTGTIPARPVTHKATSSPAAKSSVAKTFAAGFCGAALACALAFGASSLMGNHTTTVIGGSGGSTTITAEDTTSGLAEQVAQKCLPSVVSIDVYTQQSTGYYGMFGSQGSTSSELTKSSLGSGVVITEDGYILTNYHVIEGAAALKVTVEGTEYDAEIVGSDSSSDIAVIKVKNANGTKFTAIELGDSDNLTIGEWVMSIGSPFGLEQSVATGIVSATNRSQVYSESSSSSGSSSGTTIYTNLIQTDAAINPGNSGGALVNARGQLIGINTLITSYSGNYSGVGFAIPTNYAISLAEQIIKGETPSHAQLGVSTVSIDKSIAQRYGFSVDSGAYVSAVTQGSGAEAAGIQVGDIIVKVDGKAVESASDVQLAVRSKNTGDTISVTVNRDGKELTLQATLGSDAASSSSSQGSMFNFGGSSKN